MGQQVSKNERKIIHKEKHVVKHKEEEKVQSAIAKELERMLEEDDVLFETYDQAANPLPADEPAVVITLPDSSSASSRKSKCVTLPRLLSPY